MQKYRLKQERQFQREFKRHSRRMSSIRMFGTLNDEIWEGQRHEAKLMKIGYYQPQGELR